MEQLAKHDPCIRPSALSQYTRGELGHPFKQLWPWLQPGSGVPTRRAAPCDCASVWRARQALAEVLGCGAARPPQSQCYVPICSNMRWGQIRAWGGGSHAHFRSYYTTAFFNQCLTCFSKMTWKVKSQTDLPNSCSCVISHLQLCVAPWTVALQAPPSMGFPRQEYWSGLPFPAPGHLLSPGTEPTSPSLAGGFFTIGAAKEVMKRCFHLSVWQRVKR